MTASSSPTEMVAYRPSWYRRPALLDRITLITIGLASATEFVVPPLQGYGFVAWIPLIVSLLGIAVSYRWRWVGLAVIAAAPFVANAVDWDPLMAWNLAVFAAFSLAVRGMPAVMVGLVIGSANYVSVSLFHDQGFVYPVSIVAFAFALAAAAAGSATRSQDRYRRELEQRSLEALATRDAEANQRVSEERLRIARDLHDVVGHEIAVLNMHLGVAEVSLPAEAATARSSLTSARSNVQAVLSETQRILHVLRTDEPESAAGDASRPTPDLGGIARLIDSYRSAGVEVQAELCEAPEAIDAEVSTAAFRIVQEALTNSQRHGPGAVSVTTRSDGGILTITVTNARARRAPKTAAARRGYGLIGMRERATSAGGRLEVVDTDDAFIVVATLRIDGGQIR
ncbi:histidine kinase [Agreia sp. PsM10]|uniref:sensor histidine kinase n=1 Tax=Agreia sp. PsM10 TaxID=3030533 RepID=UPI00263B7586|nr:histidine kinase [Agreia sp. PsM10]MDN4639937.1 histidine kinase [Agreia sp. PsM10]